MQSFVLLPPSNDMPQEAETAAGRYRCKGCSCSGRLHVYLSLDARCQMPDARLLDVELLESRRLVPVPGPVPARAQFEAIPARGKWAKAKGGLLVAVIHASISPLESSRLF